MENLNFVKWKWLITKSIDNLVIWAWFECSIETYYILCKSINKVMTLSIELDSNIIELNCSINTDTNNYLSFQWTHWLVKLDIIFPDVLLSGYILKWNIWIN